ncbi:MAG: DHH family phosphoesterase [Deltaproteobacteria bacterium]|nr:DHH family phosphoesterase [Deltaproteobacteria bacterium]
MRSEHSTKKQVAGPNPATERSRASASARSPTAPAVWRGRAGLVGFAEALADRLPAGRSVLLSGPADPDGDSIGSCLALGRALELRGLRVTIVGRPGARYADLPGAGRMVPDPAIHEDVDLAIVLDGERGRLHAAVRAVFDRAPERVLLDHHQSSGTEGYTLALVAPESASTAELVLGIIDAWAVPLDPQLAAALFAGVIFDTGGFRHSNTGADTLRTAARLVEQGIDHNAITLRVLHERRPAGVAILARALASLQRPAPALAVGLVRHVDLIETDAEYSDLEGVVDQLLHVEGVELAVLFIEREPGLLRLSLRSRRQVDCAALARALDPAGGGHRRAAGCVISGPPEMVLHVTIPALLAAVHAAMA